MSDWLDEVLGDWTPIRCPKCGGPLAATKERGARWMCEPCVLLIIPTQRHHESTPSDQGLSTDDK